MGHRLVFLLIMDGWGISPPGKNIPRLTPTPDLDRLAQDYPTTQLSASGLDVGLPAGLMGNSEVGHLNLGAGRVVWQEITRINQAIKDGSFFKNEALVRAMEHAQKNNTSLHLMGLVSSGGVHSSDDHYFALLEMAKTIGLDSKKVFFHAALDGRDTPPTTGIAFMDMLAKKMEQMDFGRVSTVCGRYYLMDRDKRWDRVQKSYDALTSGEGYRQTNPVHAIARAYERNETDEFVKPTVIVDYKDKPIGLIKDNDSVIFFNFRADRAREITRALTEPDFNEFPRQVFPKFFYTTMTRYNEKFNLPAAFQPVRLRNILGEVLANHNIKQLRISETEKYAHVTYFFNGGEEKPFPGEDRILIPSPKIATYDLQPEMNALEITGQALKAIESDKYQVIILNFANSDMVGHTGVVKAAARAMEVVNEYVGKITESVLKKKGVILVTSDHGNIEEINFTKNGAHTYHTTNPVPFILVADDYKNKFLRTGGKLCDVAPTMLDILEIPQPAEMTGRSLIKLSI
ncbi:MAG: 2,3-bisphosphoglycerate-independent phosphoglycerate mutase [Planctomycetota bacterium]